MEPLGYIYKITKAKDKKESDLLPHVHIVVSLLKRWILGTHQSSVSKKHADYYLDEFTLTIEPQATVANCFTDY